MLYWPGSSNERKFLLSYAFFCPGYKQKHTRRLHIGIELQEPTKIKLIFESQRKKKREWKGKQKREGKGKRKREEKGKKEEEKKEKGRKTKGKGKKVRNGKVLLYKSLQFLSHVLFVITGCENKKVELPC